VHHPAGLFAMLTDSAVLYHAYSGDREVLRIRSFPSQVMAGKKMLHPVADIGRGRQGYHVESVPGGGFILRLKHRRSGDVRIGLRPDS